MKRHWMFYSLVTWVAVAFMMAGPRSAGAQETQPTSTPAPQQSPKQQAPKTITPGASCVTSECHQGVKSNEFTHGPLNLNQCEPCHIPIDNRHEFKAQAEGRNLCLICHEMQKQMKVVHPPFAADCAVCHNPHGGDNRYFIKGGLGAKGCLECHTDFRKTLTFVHGPVALGDCLVCHSPHQSDNKGLLVQARGDLCLGCHIDIGAEIKGAVSVHPPVAKNCEDCHSGHGGSNQYFLEAQGKELCRKCHGEFLKQIDNYKYTHTPMVEGKTCQNCHKPHASNQQFLLAKVNSQLCFTCHDKVVQGKTREIPNIKAQIESSKYPHGPVREGNCAACHQAHGSDNWDILVKPFPKDFYAPFTDHAYDLCFDCHDRTLVENEHSTATGFRNGTLNLHYLHVHREKGRSCRACHAPHASNQPMHIRSEVPFGRWVMKIEYTKTDTGGGCTTGCHMPYRYDRDHPVQNIKPEGENPTAPPAPTGAQSTEAPGSSGSQPSSGKAGAS